MTRRRGWHLNLRAVYALVSGVDISCCDVEACAQNLTMGAVFQLLSAGWALIVFPLTLLLLVNAATGTGRIFATAWLALGIAPLVVAWGSKPTRVRRVRMAAGFLAVASLGLVWLLVRAPAGTSGAQAKIRHHYANTRYHFFRFALGNVLPEVDQLMLGFTLATAWDALLTSSQAAELKRATREVYEELEADSDFHALGSAMPNVYRSMLGGTENDGHAYVLVPHERVGTRPWRVIVFLHGAGGNFKGYLWVLRELAERSHAVVVAPSYGTGNWRSANTAAIIQKTFETMPVDIPIDRADVHVIGLSNGGLGVSQLLREPQGAFRSLVFLSPVFDREEIDDLSGESSLPPILVLSGDRDDRIPPAYVQESARRLREAHAALTLKFIAGANHFAIFTRREEVLAILGDWMAKH